MRFAIGARSTLGVTPGPLWRRARQPPYRPCFPCFPWLGFVQMIFVDFVAEMVFFHDNAALV